MAEEEPKIIVDTDWKSQAQQEKERLEKETAGVTADQLPEPSFLEVVNMIGLQAMVGLGGLKTPDGQQMMPDLNVAKHNIDLLEVLQAKTKGNLEEKEQKILDTTIHELRMAFVQIASAAHAPPSPPEQNPST